MIRGGLRLGHITIPLVFFAIASVLLVSVLRSGSNELPSNLIGKDVPRFDLDPLIDQQSPNRASLRTNEIKLVNFWASWCAPCRVEHPNLETLARQGITIYGANYKDHPEHARSFLSELGNPYTAVGADPDGRIAIDWGVYGIPETFVVDEQGKILMRVAGPITSSILMKRIQPLLVEKQ